MANYMTSLDVLKVNNSESLIGIGDELVGTKVAPELAFFQASPVTKNTFKTLCVTGYPTVDFRATNADRTFSAATIANKTIELKYLDCSYVLPTAVAEQCDWGKEAAIAIQLQSTLRSAFYKLGCQIWRGSYSAGTDEGFNGLLPIIKAAGTNVIDAGNSGISDSTEVYFVSTGLTSCQLCWGNEGKLYESDVYEQLIASTDGTTGDKSGQFYYTQNIGGWVGMACYNSASVGAIINLSGTAGKVGLDDDLIAQALSTFGVGNTPQAIFMNRRSLAQLRASRTSYSPTGQPAPFPESAFGIPIICTDCIGNDGVVA